MSSETWREVYWRAVVGCIWNGTGEQRLFRDPAQLPVNGSITGRRVTYGSAPCTSLHGCQIAMIEAPPLSAVGAVRQSAAGVRQCATWQARPCGA